MNTSTPFKIESNIPLPSGKHCGSASYPFRYMKIGDSFYAEVLERNKIQCAASYFALRNPEYRFCVRRENNGFRVWRIAAAA